MPRRLRKEEVVTVQVLAEKGQNHCEIARVLGVTEGAVRYHLRRAAAGAEDGRREKVFKADCLSEAIASWVESSRDRARPVNVQELYEHLVSEHGYDGSYPSVVRFVRARYPRPRLATRPPLFGLAATSPAAWCTASKPWATSSPRPFPTCRGRGRMCCRTRSTWGERGGRRTPVRLSLSRERLGVTFGLERHRLPGGSAV
jgi:hypothetical protein